jgi:Protein of unknown function (DUF4229)
MSPAAKYTLGRLGLFVVVFVALLPLSDLHILIRVMLALVISAVAALFLLKGWRDDMARQLAGVAERRRAEKERLRAALAGDETAPAAGDRAGVVEERTDPASDAAGDRPDSTGENGAPDDRR